MSVEIKEEDDNGGSGSINSGDDVTSRETDASSCEITWVGASVSDDVFEIERRVLFDRIKVWRTPLERRTVTSPDRLRLRCDSLRHGGVSRPALRRFCSRYCVHDVPPLRKTD